MRKLLMLIATMIMCDAYGETVIWYTDANNISANSCTASGNITKPANPTKSGYRFMGWKEGVNGFAAINGTSYTRTETTNYTGTWTVTFPYGTVSGSAVQSTASGTTLSESLTGFSTRTTAPAEGNGNYTWCKVTSATVKGVSVSVSPKWWLAVRSYSPSDVRGYNASTCARDVGYGFASSNAINVRKMVFGLQ